MYHPTPVKTIIQHTKLKMSKRKSQRYELGEDDKKISRKSQNKVALKDSSMDDILRQTYYPCDKEKTAVVNDQPKRFYCEICYDAFPQNKHVHCRILRWGSKKVHQCTVCKMQFFRAERIHKHQEDFHSRELFDEFGQVLNSNEAKMIMFCEICSRCFPANSHFHGCTNSEGSQDTFQCVFCLQKFPSTAQLISHQKVAQCEMMYISEYKHNATSSNPIPEHQIFEWQLPDDSGGNSSSDTGLSITCFICGFIGSKIQLKDHYVEAKHFESRDIRCICCGTNFHSVGPKALLLSIQDDDTHSIWLGPLSKIFLPHAQLHYNAKISQCKVCQEIFQDEYFLEEHNKSHSAETKDKFWYCKLCRRTYINSDRNLSDHKLTWCGTRKNKCTLCKVMLSTKEKVAKHMNNHLAFNKLVKGNIKVEAESCESVPSESEDELSQKNSDLTSLRGDNLSIKKEILPDDADTKHGTLQGYCDSRKMGSGQHQTTMECVKTEAQNDDQLSRHRKVKTIDVCSLAIPDFDNGVQESEGTAFRDIGTSAKVDMYISATNNTLCKDNTDAENQSSRMSVDSDNVSDITTLMPINNAGKTNPGNSTEVDLDPNPKNCKIDNTYHDHNEGRRYTICKYCKKIIKCGKPFLIHKKILHPDEYTKDMKGIVHWDNAKKHDSFDKPNIHYEAAKKKYLCADCGEFVKSCEKALLLHIKRYHHIYYENEIKCLSQLECTGVRGESGTGGDINTEEGSLLSITSDACQSRSINVNDDSDLISSTSFTDSKDISFTDPSAIAIRKPICMERIRIKECLSSIASDPDQIVLSSVTGYTKANSLENLSSKSSDTANKSPQVDNQVAKVDLDTGKVKQEASNLHSLDIKESSFIMSKKQPKHPFNLSIKTSENIQKKENNPMFVELEQSQSCVPKESKSNVFSSGKEISHQDRIIKCGIDDWKSSAQYLCNHGKHTVSSSTQENQHKSEITCINEEISLNELYHSSICKTTFSNNSSASVFKIEHLTPGSISSKGQALDVEGSADAETYLCLGCGHCHSSTDDCQYNKYVQPVMGCIVREVAEENQCDAKIENGLCDVCGHFYFKSQIASNNMDILRCLGKEIVEQIDTGRSNNACKGCGLILPSDTVGKDPQEETHKVTICSFHCGICDRSFTSNESFHSHVACHSREAQSFKDVSSVTKKT